MHDPIDNLAAEPLQFSLRHDAWGRLELIEANGRRHEHVAVVPNFPLSQPDCWISLCGESGQEIVCVEKLGELPMDVRRVLEEELSRRSFVPRITRILYVSGTTEPCQWQVETDRGPTQLLLASEDDVRRLGEHQVLIIDAHGVRFLVPDMRALDAKSRRSLQWYV